MEVSIDMQGFLIFGIFLKFGYTASKLQSLFGRKDQEQKSQIAKKQKDERKKKKKKIIVGVLVGL